MRPLILNLLLVLLYSQASAQSEITGKWKSFDDETLELKSIVEVFEKGGQYHGRIVRLFRKSDEDPDPVCTECGSEDPRFNKKIIGMVILKDMKKTGAEYSEGTILDPKNGKIYRCKIWIEGSDLKLRGYLGPFLQNSNLEKS